MENELRRALKFLIIPYPEVTLEEYLHILKNDWEIRAKSDLSTYVMAVEYAPEDCIYASGLYDVKTEFCPQYDEYYKDNNSTSILEIGCGFGRMSIHISDYCKELFAVDISKTLLDIAFKRSNLYQKTNITFIETPGNSLAGVMNSSIDFAFEYIVFQHISSLAIIQQYINEVNRVLKLGGVFAMHTRNVSGVVDSISGGNTWHGCNLGPQEIRNMLVNTQLSVIKEVGSGTERCWIHLQKV